MSAELLAVVAGNGRAPLLPPVDVAQLRPTHAAAATSGRLAFSPASTTS